MAEPIIVGGDLPAQPNRRVFALAGVAAVLVIAMLVLPGMLFGGGGSESSELAPPVVGATATTVPADAPAETFEVFSDKNPFTPLVATGAAAAPEGPPEATAPPETVPPPPPVDQQAPVVSPPPAPDGETTTATTAPPPSARQPNRVSLLEVFTEPSGRVVASVRVNDATHVVAEGDEFAASYRVLALDAGARCGQFLFGDDRFALCEGEETLK